MGLGEQGGQRARVRQLVVAPDGQYSGSFGGVSWGGIHLTCLLAGGIPKLDDLGVEGHPASAQVNARVLQQGFLTLGLYDRKV